MTTRSIIAALLVLSSTSLSLANQYVVNRSVGEGIITGVIETDGTIGPLTEQNLVDWDLVFSDNEATFNMLGPLSGGESEFAVVGDSYIATETDIEFDFSNPFGDYAYFVQQGNIPFNVWCIDGNIGVCIGTTNTEALAVLGGVFHSTIHTGVVSLASAVPEPNSTALLLAGFLMVGLRQRYSRRTCSVRSV